MSDRAVAAFLGDAPRLVADEPRTLAWYAFRLGPSSFAIVDVFPSEEARQEHLEGAVARALAETAGDLLSARPDVELVDVLATAGATVE